MVPTSYYILLSALLFTFGVVGVLTRRNALVLFMSVELMLNSANLALVTFAMARQDVAGQIVVFLSLSWQPQRLQSVWRCWWRFFAPSAQPMWMRSTH